MKVAGRPLKFSSRSSTKERGQIRSIPLELQAESSIEVWLWASFSGAQFFRTVCTESY
jgi:hypothetical protein